MTAEPWTSNAGWQRPVPSKKGHFQLSSGLHSPAYVQCALLLEHPDRASRIGAELARRVAGVQSAVGSVAGDGWTDHRLHRGGSSGGPFRFVERVAGKMTLRRGFSLRQGERLVIVEDVVTTGKSTLEAIAVAEEQGAEICAVASILDRTEGKEPFRSALLQSAGLVLPTFAPEDCPLCLAGEEIDKPGSRPVP